MPDTETQELPDFVEGLNTAATQQHSLIEENPPAADVPRSATASPGMGTMTGSRVSTGEDEAGQSTTRSSSSPPPETGNEQGSDRKKGSGVEGSKGSLAGWKKPRKGS